MFSIYTYNGKRSITPGVIYIHTKSRMLITCVMRKSNNLITYYKRKKNVKYIK